MINVGGILIENELTAIQARKEEEGIRYIKERSALNNPASVLKLYNTLLAQKLFVTPVGFRFLLELQGILLASKEIMKDEIAVLNPGDFGILPEAKEEPKKKKGIKNYKKAFHIALFFAIVFGISVAGMFVIAKLSDNNVNILNYRNEIINEYEDWQQELEAREDKLKTWEEDLRNREDELK